MNFAVDALKLCDEIKRHYSLVNQLERSATSIGANIREANYAQSKPDFISKLQIALKECYETEYWLELLQKAEIVQTDNVLSLYHKCGEIRRITPKRYDVSVFFLKIKYFFKLFVERDAEQEREFRRRVERAGFDSADGIPRNADHRGELLLRKPLLFSYFRQAVAKYEFFIHIKSLRKVAISTEP